MNEGKNFNAYLAALEAGKISVEQVIMVDAVLSKLGSAVPVTIESNFYEAMELVGILETIRGLGVPNTTPEFSAAVERWYVKLDRLTDDDGPDDDAVEEALASLNLDL